MRVRRSLYIVLAGGLVATAALSLDAKRGVYRAACRMAVLDREVTELVDGVVEGFDADAAETLATRTPA